VPDSLRRDLDNKLAEKGAEAMLLYAESYKEVNMYYLTKFLAPDPFIFLKRIDREPIIIVNQMEHARAQKESMVKDVRCYTDYNYFETVKSAPDPNLGVLRFISATVKKELGTKTRVYVPPNFPTMVADSLGNAGLPVTPQFDVVEKIRETKENDEVNEIRTVQATTETATRKAIDLIANAETGPDGTLITRTDGKKEPLTVGRARAAFAHECLDHGCGMEDEIIIACGTRGTDPHYTGNSEDQLKANQPIILDVFPRSTRRRYWADMTRTVVKGRAPKKVKAMFEAVLEAKNASIAAIKTGVAGSHVYNLCCNVLEKAGYATTRGGKKITKGLTHGLGHGVGLQIHEGPSMGEFYTLGLEEHNILTVEPGLYDPDVGGVRLEDMVEVTKTGCKNLTKMEITLEV
jgi:Xaa-Pro aminopeptidase